MARNPFTPTFGVSPPLLVAREDELASFAEALDDGPGAPGRAMLFTGARGCGKTVLLNAVEEEARGRGWLVLSATVRPGVAQEIAAVQLPALLGGVRPGCGNPPHDRDRRDDRWARRGGQSRAH